MSPSEKRYLQYRLVRQGYGPCRLGRIGLPADMRDQALLGLGNDRHGGQIAAHPKLWESTSSRSRPVSGGSPRSSVFPHVLRLAIHNAKTLNRIRTRENYLFGISHRNPRICQDAAPSRPLLQSCFGFIYCVSNPPISCGSLPGVPDLTELPESDRVG
jgi:hypothetical protein